MKTYPLKRRRFSKRAKAAIRAYYGGRKVAHEGGPKWDKQSCLDEIIAATSQTRGSGIRAFTGCAGTFWFGWSDGVTTCHNESNWWRMRKNWY